MAPARFLAGSGLEPFAIAMAHWLRVRISRQRRHAVRAPAREAGRAREAWERVRCPVLVIHGMLSDALLPGTIGRMCKKTGLQVMHVPDTGHTPILYDDNQIHFVRSWLDRSALAQGCWCVLHAPPSG